MTESKADAAANKELVLRFMRATEADDHDLMTECLAEDYVQVFPRPGPRGIPSGVESRAQFMEFVKALPVYERGSVRIEIENVMAEGPIVALQFQLRATTARGEAYENYYVLVFECRGNKLAKCWEYTDTLYATRMLMPALLDTA